MFKPERDNRTKKKDPGKQQKNAAGRDARDYGKAHAANKSQREQNECQQDQSLPFSNFMCG